MHVHVDDLDIPRSRVLHGKHQEVSNSSSTSLDVPIVHLPPAVVVRVSCYCLEPNLSQVCISRNREGVFCLSGGGVNRGCIRNGNGPHLCEGLIHFLDEDMKG